MNSAAKVSKDNFIALHELAYMLQGFVWSITTYPDLIVTCGMLFFTELMQKASLYMLSYDTTFNLGDFYLSVLVAQVECFVEHPCFPVAYLIHDRKFEETHLTFFKKLQKHVTCGFTPTIVTDGELAAINAIKSTFPHWNTVSCWNHILTDVEVWLKKHHVGASEIAIYKSTIRELLQCLTSDEYNTKRETLSSTWTELFKDYYTKFLSTRVLTSYAGYLKSLNISMESVTNNISESFNGILKRHQDWNEVSVDSMLLVLYKLQLFYKSQIAKSLQGFGPYTLDITKTCG